MSFSDLTPLQMARVAVVVPRSRLRRVLTDIADAGVMEIDQAPGEDSERAAEENDAERIFRDAPDDVEPRLQREEPELEELKEGEKWDLLAGEVELSRRERQAIAHGSAEVFLGWVPGKELEDFERRLADQGSSVVHLPRPRTAEPPTRMPTGRFRRWVRPLVQTYAVVPYEDVDPSLFAAVTYVLMFGMMFGDVGHGLILCALGMILSRTKHPRLQTFRRLWFFPVAAGLSATAFGFLYGEAFGPTGLVPTLWLAPLEEPVRLLITAIGAGATLIGGSYVIGTVNRWREGGVRMALYSSTGMAGAALFLGAALFAMGFVWASGTLRLAGGALAALGLLLSFVGFKAEAGEGGGALGQALVEAFDAVSRILANVLSFGRLAAFGMTHAALGLVVWQGTQSLWGGAVGTTAAVVLFLLGNALTFSLEALVAGVQALRLEYYELFSRVFSGQGRLFEPWHLPIANED